VRLHLLSVCLTWAATKHLPPCPPSSKHKDLSPLLATTPTQKTQTVKVCTEAYQASSSPACASTSPETAMAVYTQLQPHPHSPPPPPSIQHGSLHHLQCSAPSMHAPATSVLEFLLLYYVCIRVL
jgi:hypothetical protein